MLQSSRNSLAAVAELTNAQIDAGSPAALGDGLLGIVGVLAEEYTLRRTLVDNSLAQDAKTGLLDALFGTRTDASALDIVKQAVARRWVYAQDLLTALEDSGVTALAAAAAAQGQLGSVEEELFRFTRRVAGEQQLELALESQAPVDAKFTLLDSLLDGKVGATTVQLVKQAVAHPRGRRTVEVLESYSAILARRQQRAVADVTVARDLSQAQADRLAGALSASYGRALALNVHVDPTVVGGVRVQVGDEVMNSTIQDRLADLKRQLAG